MLPKHHCPQHCQGTLPNLKEHHLTSTKCFRFPTTLVINMDKRLFWKLDLQSGHLWTHRWTSPSHNQACHWASSITWSKSLGHTKKICQSVHWVCCSHWGDLLQHWASPKCRRLNVKHGVILFKMCLVCCLDVLKCFLFWRLYGKPEGPPRLLTIWCYWRPF